MKRFGPNLRKSQFSYIANKVSNAAKHVAIKNKVLRLSSINSISYAQVQAFETHRSCPDVNSSIVDMVNI